jgi:hypothetical protein
LNKLKHKASISKRLGAEALDHLLTAQEIRKRKAKARGKRVAWETLKAKHGLSRLGG